MNIRLVVSMACGVMLSVPVWTTSAAAPGQGAGKAAMQEQETVYGSELMTQKERMEHRARMHAAKTDEERETIRKAHHEKMKERAKERGVKLPDEPPAGGAGMGRGGGGMGYGRGGR